MKRHTSAVSGERGFVLVYMAAILALLMVTTGLAVDSGRAYLVKAQLSKAVDGAALAAARSLNSGNPRAEATQIFKANFPAGYLGTSSSSDPTAAANFFNSTVNVVSVWAGDVAISVVPPLAADPSLSAGVLTPVNSGSKVAVPTLPLRVRFWVHDA